MTTCRFTIAIPAHDRPELTRMTIQSAIEQSYDDFDVVVSDNSYVDENARVTSSFVDGLNDRRVTYVRAPARLSFGNHFEWLSQRLGGEFVIFLNDDDALAPDTLETIDSTLTSRDALVITLRAVQYYPKESGDPAFSDTLRMDPMSGEIFSIATRAVLESCYRRFQLWQLPLPQLSFVSRQLLDRIRGRYGRLFLDNAAADFGVAMLLLHVVESYLLLDAPYFIQGVTAKSVGAASSHTRGEATLKFVQEAGGISFIHSPISIRTGGNAIAESLWDVRDLVRPEMDDLDVAMPAFYQTCKKEIAQLRDNGVDTSWDEAELKRLHSRLSIFERLEVASSGIRGAMYSNRAMGPFVRRIRGMVTKTRHGRPLLDRRARPGLFKGSQNGFTSIIECARKLPAIRSECLP